MRYIAFQFCGFLGDSEKIKKPAPIHGGVAEPGLCTGLLTRDHVSSNLTAPTKLQETAMYEQDYREHEQYEDDYGHDDKCTCDNHKYPPHTCPFKEEIVGDHDTECTCCPYCEHECSMDI